MGDQEVPKKSPLAKAWETFWYVIADPWTLLASVMAILLYSAGRKGGATPEVDSLLDIFMAITTGVLGGRITARISSLTEESVLFARGKVAVRSLKLLLRNTAALEERTRKLSALPDNNPAVTQRNYEEIVEACRSLQEQAISSIENWTDIVPEADINTQVGQISELRSKLDQKEEEVRSLGLELEGEKKKTQTQDDESARKVITLERALLKAQREVTQLNSQLFLANSAITTNKPFNFLGGNFRDSNFVVGGGDGLLGDTSSLAGLARSGTILTGTPSSPAPPKIEPLPKSQMPTSPPPPDD